MIYFDNAATGGFKPSSVTDAFYETGKFLLANPGRSGHRLSVAGANIILNCRLAIKKMFDADCPEHVIFTKNCTEALNTAIFGILKKGDHVITTVFEHNSVLRPLYFLKNSGVISLTVLQPENSNCFLNGVKKAVKKNTRMVIMTAVSNVTGAKTDFEEVGNFTHLKNLIFLLDGAQGAGHIEISMKKHNINVLCLAGHKGLYGIMGSGVLVFDENIDVRPLIFGGTGTETFNKNQPDTYPERLESGTLSLPVISALYEGVRFAEKHLRTYSDHLLSMTEQLILYLSVEKDIHLYSLPNRSGIVSFSVGNDSSQIADALNEQFDIAVRGGYHCAPLMHDYLGTNNGGLVRVSLAPENTYKELNEFYSAIKRII